MGGLRTRKYKDTKSNKKDVIEIRTDVRQLL